MSEQRNLSATRYSDPEYLAAATFGTTFTSGSFHFGGGDSNEEIEKQRRELKGKPKPRA